MDACANWAYYYYNYIILYFSTLRLNQIINSDIILKLKLPHRAMLEAGYG